ncbi:hypothetical protein RZ760_012180 [Providencia rettgeri]|nr:hypothetical protein [Providencia rettgeri]
MDIRYHALETACSNFKNHFEDYFDWDDIDVSFTSIDTQYKEVKTISNNYEWLLTYWDDDLDLLVSERLEVGFQYWDGYTDSYANTFSKTEKNGFKIDYCNRYGNTYKILSISSKRKLSVDELMEIYFHRADISDYAHQAWQKNQSLALPFRADIEAETLPLLDEEQQLAGLVDTQKFIQFGNISFNYREAVTLRLLLSNCQISEISAMQGCTDAIELKRLQRIKEKLGCPDASPDELRSTMTEHGIILIGLERLANFYMYM